jgi:hypothetical protein
MDLFLIFCVLFWIAAELWFHRQAVAEILGKLCLGIGVCLIVLVCFGCFLSAVYLAVQFLHWAWYS